MPQENVIDVAGVSVESAAPASVTNSTEYKRNFIQKFKDWFNGLVLWEKILIVFSFVLVIVLFIIAGVYGYIVYSGYKNQQNNVIVPVNKTTPTPTPSPTVISEVNPLTGETLIGDAVKNLHRPPLAVMIENSTDARPQTGLNKADLVYETLAEGGITRFMPVFLGQAPDKVGPVRSARPYFLDWVREFNAIYVHFGENSDVTPSLKSDNIRNVDGIYLSSEGACSATAMLFCRDSSRQAPHNAYTNTSKAWDYGAKNSWTDAGSFSKWMFKADEKEALRGKDGATLNVNFMTSDRDYNMKWVYNIKDNDFLRYSGDGTAHIDKADNTQLTAKNVVVRYVTGRLYTSSGGKVIWQYDNIGSGNASVFVDGKEIDGKWSNTVGGRTTYTDNSGVPIKFDIGRTWIETLVTNTGNFTFK